MIKEEIKLRKLQMKDAEWMLEWMHDESVTAKYKTDFGKFTLQDAAYFICHSFSEDNQHFAVVDERDQYLGTVSLKNISKYNKNAEMTSAFLGHVGDAVYSKAIALTIAYAFDELGLEEIYIHVFEDNVKMIDYYLRMGFQKGGTYVSQLNVRGESKKLCWYYKRKCEQDRDKHQLLHFQEQGDTRGHMVIIEELKDIPFQIKRLFYIYGSQREIKRGLHANRKSEFVLVNLVGTSKVKVFDGKTEQIYELSKPHTGVYLPKMVWKEMYDFSDDAVLLVLSNEIYDPHEYIREWDDYLREVTQK